MVSIFPGRTLSQLLPLRGTMTAWASLVVLAFAAVVAAAPSARHTLKVKETINAPRGWTKREEAPPHLTIDLRIALPQPNFAQLEKELYEVRQVGRSVTRLHPHLHL